MDLDVKIRWKDGTTDWFRGVTECCEIGNSLYIKFIYPDGDYDQGWYNKDEIRYYELCYRKEKE